MPPESLQVTRTLLLRKKNVQAALTPQHYVFICRYHLFVTIITVILFRIVLTQPGCSSYCFDSYHSGLILPRKYFRLNSCLYCSISYSFLLAGELYYCRARRLCPSFVYDISVYHLTDMVVLIAICSRQLKIKNFINAEIIN